MDGRYEIAIVGGGPAGISMAVEARYADIPAERILILEKGDSHSAAIRRHYPDDKIVAENYKGFDVFPEGVLGITDMAKTETLFYINRAVEEHGLKINYDEAVTSIQRCEHGGFMVGTNRQRYEAEICVIAIGILDKPNKPEYRLPRRLKGRIHFEIPSSIEGDSVLVVGGGDTAGECVRRLYGSCRMITLSYRGNDFDRMSEINREVISGLESKGELEVLRRSNISRVAVDGGRPRVFFKEDACGQRTFDHIVYCLGGSTPKNFLKGMGIDFDGEAPVLGEGYETSIPGLFLIGDLSAGQKGGSINWAFNSSHAAMRRIVEGYLTRPARLQKQ